MKCVHVQNAEVVYIGTETSGNVQTVITQKKIKQTQDKQREGDSFLCLFYCKEKKGTSINLVDILEI